MNPDYLVQLGQGLLTSLELTVASILVGATLALAMTIILALRYRVAGWLCQGFITLFTGTPLLVQIALIYHGPGQFDAFRASWLWHWFSHPWFCAMLAMALNTAAYTTQLFSGALKAIPGGQWQACRALGMNRRETLQVVLPYALRRALPAYSNEVILVFKGTSLASTVTIMDIMGYAQRINSLTYDTLTIFGMAGALYLLINGILTLLFRLLERRALAFENPGS